MNLLQIICRLPLFQSIVVKRFRGSEHPVNFLGLRFCHPVGLGAGFDKNARYLNEIQALGFSFVEIGTVTPRPQSGNPKPRLFRLPKDLALINRMGFNNDGVQAAAEKLSAFVRKNKSRANRLIIGGNIGKNKDTPNERAWEDYVICFRALHSWVDFFVVNVSSPNTPGLRELQDKESLRVIFQKLREAETQFENRRPILLKLAPDLSKEQLDDVIALAREIALDGIVATNTTIARTHLKTDGTQVSAIGAGGLSGLPLRTRANEVVSYIHQQVPGLPIIGSGGIFSGEDASERIHAGAGLIEVWTSFIYEGPKIVKNITASLK